MRRRAFLGTAVAGAALAGSTSWIERAFAQPPAGDGLAVLSTAYRRAQRAGKPLLVIVIPADVSAKHLRGQAFGEAINFGSDAVMATLATCEVACAEIAAVRQLVPQLPARPAEPLLVLIETDAVPARVRPLDGPIAAPFDGPIGALIVRGVAPDDTTIARRAAQARARLGATRVAQIERALAAGSLQLQEADAAAAIVAERARRATGAARARLTAVLAAAGIARVRARRIDGSHWASSWGCGVDIEDTPVDEGGMMDCGMGHVGPRARRFLYFFAPRSLL